MAQPDCGAPGVRVIGHWIGGEPASSGHARTGPVFDPSSGRVAAKVSYADASVVESAVAAAQAAWPAWAATPALRRARVLFRFKELLDRHAAELARTIATEHGKVLADAAGEVTRGIEVVEFACGAPHLLAGEMCENIGVGVDSYSLRQPLGVVAGITPFNFPAMVPMWMFPVALACGNSFVLKPSERDPSASLVLAELLRDAGLPKGVFNVVQGERQAVEALIAHPDVQALSFVGSTAVAGRIYAEATARGKRVQALGGAKNHLVAMPDADADGVADALMGAAFGSAGERCMAVSAFVAVGEAMAEAVAARLKARIAELRVGASLDPNSDMGPLVSAAHLERVRDYIALGIEEGAQLLVDGRERVVAGCEDGFFLGPCLFDCVRPGMRIYREEIFGPVLIMLRVANFEEALALVNGHSYGNGAAIFTRDGNAAREFASRVRVGMVGVNVPIPVPMAFMSFGGWKASLFGDHAVYGAEGIRFYTRLKTVTQRWPDSMRDGAEYVMPTMK